MPSYDIKRLRELEAKAVPAPWHPDPLVISSDAEGPGHWVFGDDAPDFDMHNVNLICAMRNALPRLLDEYEAMRDYVEAQAWYLECAFAYVWFFAAETESEYENTMIAASEAVDAAWDALLKRGGGE